MNLDRDQNGSDGADNVKEYKFKKVTRGGVEEGYEPVAVERSYDLIVNGMRLASIMSSPSDLEELAYGYLVSEGVVDSSEQIATVKLRDDELHAFIEGSEKIEQWMELRSSGCVGVRWEDKEEYVKVESPFEVDSELVFKALEHLDNPLYERTSGSHSASLINGQGEAVARSVDVGRHNTFDKVIGKAILKDADLSHTLLIASGRQSAGMVMKAARAGIPIVASKAAPLSSGIDAAERTNLTLICFVDDRKFSIFAGGKNVEGGEKKGNFGEE